MVLYLREVLHGGVKKKPCLPGSGMAFDPVFYDYGINNKRGMLVPLSDDLSSCFNIQIISDIALAEIGDGCPKLKEIALSHCPEVTNVGLEHLVRGCLQLESCQMVYCRRITSSGVDHKCCTEQNGVPTVASKVMTK